MKKILVLALFCIIISTNIFADDFELLDSKTQENIKNYNVFSETTAVRTKERRFTIQTSPLFHMFNLFSFGSEEGLFIIDLEGQYKFNNTFNISFATSFLINNWNYWGNEYQIIFKPMFIYRPFHTGLRGFYLGLYTNIGWYTRYNGWPQVNRELFMQIGAGLNTGYKWIFNNGFTLQLGTGIGKTLNVSNDHRYPIFNSDGRLTLRRFDLQILDFKIGYSF